MTRKDLPRQIAAYAGIVLIFIVLSYAYCAPVLKGMIVNQSDISGWTGMAQETIEHNRANPGDPTLWTNSMFGGMPNVTMYDKFEGDLTNPVYKFLMLGRRPASYIFIALLGAFLLMLSLGVDKLLAVGGAIAVAFCSYNMQIIQVGHNTKMQAIAFFPWVLAALIFTYRSALRARKAHTLLGSVLFALALSMQIKANHPQITWYLAAVVFIYALALFIGLCTGNDGRARLKSFFTASVLLLCVGLVGIATNANKLLPTYNYAKYTMRGGSELTGDGQNSSKGLQLDYATAWSYGIEETPNLLIPNYNGGSSASALGKDSETAKLLRRYGYKGRELDSVLQYMPTYWGPQPFTAGPMYMGAVTFFLFILGCLVCRGRDKWWMIAASLFAVFLAWGCNMMWFTRLCYNLLPMYSKFRTVSMALIVLQCTLPMLGFLALSRIFNGELTTGEMRKKTAIAAAVTIGLCLLFFLIQKSAGSFTGAGDQKELAAVLAKDRASMLSSDTFRSILFAALAFAAVFILGGDKMQTGRVKGRSILAVVIALLTVLDMFPVDRRYLNNSHFVEKKEFANQFEQRAVDKIILEDSDPSYRVLDLSVNTFNDSHPSYWHKCIGGYSPTKLQRYQDLIDRYISSEMRLVATVVNREKTVRGVEENFPDTPVLDMLNTRYVIVDDSFPPITNFNACGNCWFVNGVVEASSADEEIALLGGTDPREKAVIRSEDLPSVQFEEQALDMDDIRLDSYKANELRYSFATGRERLAVFSEIWHPGWKASVNGEPLEIFRADWVLRAAVIPAGTGEIVMRYEPEDYKVGKAVSTAGSVLLLLLLVLSAGGLIWSSRSSCSPSGRK